MYFGLYIYFINTLGWYFIAPTQKKNFISIINIVSKYVFLLQAWDWLQNFL